MKVVLITTTIHVPHVLRLYRKLNEDVHFIVIGDKKTPHEEVRSFIHELGNAAYYSDSDQETLGYKCSEIIGWNKIMRRNIGILEALKHGAEIIISIDDDNIPLGSDYFKQFERTLTEQFHGVMASSKTGWFNIGEFLTPQVYHRGFPFEQRPQEPSQLVPVTGVKIGVSAGLWLGDPDVDAVNRLADHPRVTGISDVIRNGVAVQSGCFAPFDSQNTAYVRELAPLMMLSGEIGRYDDIWASYITERVIAGTDYCVHYGCPLVYQERNPQNLLRNLKDEIFGMEHTQHFITDLRAAKLTNPTVIGKLAQLYDQLPNWLQITKLGKTWLKDLEKVV